MSVISISPVVSLNNPDPNAFLASLDDRAEAELGLD
jgi:hypothetical protein